MTDLQNSYPSIEYLRAKARRRIPHFANEQLEAGTGNDQTLKRNRSAFNELQICPRQAKKSIQPSLDTTLFDQTYSVPFGVAPIGGTSLFWPGGEEILACSAGHLNFPYGFSMVSCSTPEIIGPLAGGNGWFQLYPPHDEAMRDDLIKRAIDGGFSTMIITMDVPEYGMRERAKRAGLSQPPRLCSLIGQAAICPNWLAAIVMNGVPKFRTIQPYIQSPTLSSEADFVLNKLNQAVDGDYLDAIRRLWPGKLVAKGILNRDDARFAIDHGVDGIVVSNHGGRQFDAAPASIEVLPSIAAEFGGETTIIFDSGVRTGMDIAKALMCGADFVLLGRAFIYGIAALGGSGGDHVYHLLKEDFSLAMKQLGAKDIQELKSLNFVKQFGERFRGGTRVTR